MTEPDQTKEDEREDSAVRDLLKRALSNEALGHGSSPDLLQGVQRRIRRRSRGKFFADGWSTTHTRMSYAIVGVTTLILVALACFVLSPWYSP